MNILNSAIEQVDARVIYFILFGITLFFIVTWWQIIQQRNAFARRLVALEKQLRVITSGSVGMGEHILKLESELKNIRQKRHHDVETEAQYSYSQAVKLIQQGVDASTVAANCGLSDCEIQLMELIHNNTRAAHVN